MFKKFFAVSAILFLALSFCFVSCPAVDDNPSLPDDDYSDVVPPFEEDDVVDEPTTPSEPSDDEGDVTPSTPGEEEKEPETPKTPSSPEENEGGESGSGEGEASGEGGGSGSSESEGAEEDGDGEASEGDEKEIEVPSTITLTGGGKGDVKLDKIEVITDFGEWDEQEIEFLGVKSKSYICKPAATTTCVANNGQVAISGSPCNITSDYINTITFKKDSVKDFNYFEIEIQLTESSKCDIELQDLSGNAKHHAIKLYNSNNQWGYSTIGTIDFTTEKQKLGYYFPGDGKVHLYVNNEFKNSVAKPNCLVELLDGDNLKLLISKESNFTLYSVGFYKKHVEQQ